MRTPSRVSEKETRHKNRCMFTLRKNSATLIYKFPKNNWITLPKYSKITDFDWPFLKTLTKAERPELRKSEHFSHQNSPQKSPFKSILFCCILAQFPNSFYHICKRRLRDWAFFCRVNNQQFFCTYCL